MKLVNKRMAGQKLGLASGLVSIDAEGVCEVEDKAAIEALQRSGFKPVFARKEAAVTEPKKEEKPAAEAPKVEEVKEAPKAKEEPKAPVSTSKTEEPKKKKGK